MRLTGNIGENTVITTITTKLMRHTYSAYERVQFAIRLGIAFSNESLESLEVIK